MKKISFFILLTALLLVLCSCACKHENYSAATCTDPSICQKCEESVSAALGHTWADATCTEPKTCSVCDATEGEAIGHTWNNATCTLSKTCSVCQEVEGDPLGHTWLDATCVAPKTCSVCQTTEGEALGHSYEESITLLADCLNEGKKKFSCKNCTDIYEESYKLEVLDADALYELANKSVGEIVTYNKSGNEIALGTGFLLDNDGKVVTSYHVIEGAYSIKITINNITYNVKQVLAYDKTIDLAVLKIDAKNLTALPVCYNNHSVGKTIYSFGSSKGLTSTFSQGIITYLNREINGVKYIQHDSAISSGNSGGPLINQFGEIIGINTWVVKDSQNLNFAISASELKNLKYDAPLTVEQLYEKEFHTLARLKSYIMRNGEYDEEDKEYVLFWGYTYTQDLSYVYTRCAYYSVEDDAVILAFVINDSDVLLINLNNELNGTYEWAYVITDGHAMIGTFNAGSFTENSTLSYSEHNFTTSSSVSDAKALASAMAVELCSYLDEDLAVISATAEDLGFKNF